jgi:hypothetical protein
MKDPVRHSDDPGERLVPVKTILADTEELLKAVGTESKENTVAAKPRIEPAMQLARR